MSHVMPDLNSKSLQQALSITSLTNICFKKCVVKQPASSEHQQLTAKTEGILQMLQVDSEGFELGEKETVCIHNCAKAYIDLKGNIHN